MVFHINLTPLKIKINKSSLVIPKSTFYPLQDGMFFKTFARKKNRGHLKLQSFNEMIEKIYKRSTPV